MPFSSVPLESRALVHLQVMLDLFHFAKCATFQFDFEEENKVSEVRCGE